MFTHRSILVSCSAELLLCSAQQYLVLLFPTLAICTIALFSTKDTKVHCSRLWSLLPRGTEWYFDLALALLSKQHPSVDKREVGGYYNKAKDI